MIRKIRLYCAFVLLFVLWKPLFMCYHWDLYGAYPWREWLAVMWHGLPHDLTVAGYLTALPLLLELGRIWMPGAWHTAVMRWYIRIVLVPLLLVLFTDLELYTHWGFRLDATPLIYLTDNPVSAIRQTPMWALLVLPLVLAATWWILQHWLCHIFPARRRGDMLRMPTARGRAWLTVGWAALVALLFVAIRGGVTVSTMNVGRVYFSTELPLNHAATNPVFSLIASMSKTEDFATQYRFMTDDDCAAALRELYSRPAATERPEDDSLQTCILLPPPAEAGQDAPSSPAPTGTSAGADAPLLRSERPDVILILLESFSGSCCPLIDPEADPTILPHVTRLMREGIGFTNLYANSFRTDRGCAAVLAAYPAQPTYSVMKNAQKCENLPYLSRRMAEYGYRPHFIHGGDADFTNLRGFLRCGAVERITADADFPLSDRLSKWGVPDHLTFDYLRRLVLTEHAARASAAAPSADTDAAQPMLKIFLTLSSHEPFDVPYRHFADPYVNAAAYTDSCLGAFVDSLKASPAWDNLLIVGVPDHCFARYPATLQNHEPLRYHIPAFMTGGAVAAPRLIDTYGSQTDLAATLLAALGMPHDDFTFSKDLLDPTLPHFAFYTWPDGFGMLTDSCRYIQDNLHDGHPLTGSYDPHGTAQRWGKAYLQSLYDDLSRR